MSRKDVINSENPIPDTITAKLGRSRHRFNKKLQVMSAPLPEDQPTPEPLE